MAKKSMLREIKNVSRTAAKATGYLAGSALIAWPLIDFTTKVIQGTEPKVAADQAIYNGFGYALSNGNIEMPKVRSAAIRTLAGAGLIYMARKL